ncbi:hypothetical protein U1Q18_051303 [Sarracenia purpurea var. burkii]
MGSKLQSCYWKVFYRVQVFCEISVAHFIPKMKHFYLFAAFALVIFAMNVEVESQTGPVEPTLTYLVSGLNYAAREVADIFNSQADNDAVCEAVESLPGGIQQIGLQYIRCSPIEN